MMARSGLIALFVAVTLGTAWLGPRLARSLSPFDVAMNLIETGRAAEAVYLLEDPAWRGIAEYRAGRYRRALAEFARGRSVQGFYNMGNTYARLHEWAGAESAYRMVLDLDPDHENARHNLDVIARAREAERALREASEQKSDRPGMRDGSQTDAADSGDESETVEDGAKTGGNSVQAAATPVGIPGHTTGSGLPCGGEVTGGLAGQSNAPGESSVPEDLVGDSGGRTQDTEASGNIELLFGLVRDDPRRVLTARLKAAHAQGEER